MRDLKEQEILKSYILGNIADEELPAIEERLMADEEYFWELTMAEEDLIQEYVDEKLGSPERERFEKCFLISGEHRAKVKFARAMRKYVDEAKKTPQAPPKPGFLNSLKSFFLSPVPAACAILIVLGIVGLLVWKNLANRSEVSIALNKAYSAERPIDSRITDFDYAPAKHTRGGGEGEKPDKIQRDLAKMLALRDAAENSSAESLHALGRVYLAEREFDKAIEQFEKALKSAPNDAKLHNDLGAALMEKAKNQDAGKFETLTKANEEFAKAIESDKNLPDAYFNQALCLQALNSSNQAKEAWRKYLEIDANSKWSEEARRNLELLEK